MSLIDLLDYIDTESAAEHLSKAAGLTVSHEQLLEMCENTGTPVYIDCTELIGCLPVYSASGYTMAQIVGTEVCTVDMPMLAGESESFNVTGAGVCIVSDDAAPEPVNCSWVLTDTAGRKMKIASESLKRLERQVNGG